MGVKPLVIMGLVAISLAWIATLISLATPYWAVGERDGVKYHLGVFQNCTSKGCNSTSSASIQMDRVKGFELSGAAIGSLGLIVVILYVVLEVRGKDPSTSTAIGGFVLCFVAGILILIGSIIFIWDLLIDTDSDVDWTFYLSIAGASMYILPVRVSCMTVCNNAAC